VILKLAGLFPAHPLAQRVGQAMSAVLEGLRQSVRKRSLAADDAGSGGCEREPFDLVYGVAGLGTYLTARMEDRAAQRQAIPAVRVTTRRTLQTGLAHGDRRNNHGGQRCSAHSGDQKPQKPTADGNGHDRL